MEEKHRAHIYQRDGKRTSPSAAFLATNSKANKDLTKNARPSCAVCGKTGHAENQCFNNELASCPKAISRAPIGTPLHRKHHPSSQLTSPRNSDRHNKTPSASAARALAASTHHARGRLSTRSSEPWQTLSADAACSPTITKEES